MWLLLYVTTLSALSLPLTSHAFGTNNGKCERISEQIPMCMHMRYNETKMPNMIGQTSQHDAASSIAEFLPLVRLKCSPLLHFFLCSVFAPMCTEQVNEVLVIPACRSMCENVKEKCEPYLRQFDLEWPDMLSCERLPVKSDMSGDLCMQAPDPDQLDMADIGWPGDVPGYDMMDSKHWQRFIDQLHKLTSSTQRPPTATPVAYQCPQRFVYVPKLRHNDSSACAPRCNLDVYFRQQDKRVAEIWMTVWASLCLVSTLLTIFTFIQNTSRFLYPERPIVFLAMCYAIYSCAYIIRAVVGPTAISCDETPSGELYLIQEGLESTWCTIIFLIMYYFGMASSVWWLVLSFAWFLSAAYQWGSEAIQRLGSYFHLAAWALPAVNTIIILVQRRVDGDQLTGMCYVGNQDPTSLLIFVIIPHVIYIVIGAFFILAGFVSLFGIRGKLKREGTTNANLNKLEKLMAKIGAFSILFSVCSATLVGCLLYEYMHMNEWKANTPPCTTVDSKQLQAGSRNDVTLDCQLEESVPITGVFLLKLLMYLLVGVASGLWICSRKTLQSWGAICWRSSRHHKTTSPAHTTTTTAVKNSTSNSASLRANQPIYNYQKCATTNGRPLQAAQASDPMITA